LSSLHQHHNVCILSTVTTSDCSDKESRFERISGSSVAIALSRYDRVVCYCHLTTRNKIITTAAAAAAASNAPSIHDNELHSLDNNEQYMCKEAKVRENNKFFDGIPGQNSESRRSNDFGTQA
jgi:hypothetical protein